MRILLTLTDSDLSRVGHIDHVLRTQPQERGWHVDVDRNIMTRTTLYLFTSGIHTKLKYDKVIEDADHMDMEYSTAEVENIGEYSRTEVITSFDFCVRGTEIRGGTIMECLRRYQLYKDGSYVHALRKEDMGIPLGVVNRSKRIVILGGGYE